MVDKKPIVIILFWMGCFNYVMYKAFNLYVEHNGTEYISLPFQIIMIVTVWFTGNVMAIFGMAAISKLEEMKNDRQKIN